MLAKNRTNVDACESCFCFPFLKGIAVGLQLLIRNSISTNLSPKITKVAIYHMLQCDYCALKRQSRNVAPTLALWKTRNAQSPNKSSIAKPVKASLTRWCYKLSLMQCKICRSGLSTPHCKTRLLNICCRRQSGSGFLFKT